MNGLVDCLVISGLAPASQENWMCRIPHRRQQGRSFEHQATGECWTLFHGVPFTLPVFMREIINLFHNTIYSIVYQWFIPHLVFSPLLWALPLIWKEHWDTPAYWKLDISVTYVFQPSPMGLVRFTISLLQLIVWGEKIACTKFKYLANFSKKHISGQRPIQSWSPWRLKKLI